MTTEEYECQLNTAIACVEAFKRVLDALSEVDDVVGRPGEPCPVASQAAVKRIRRIVQGVEAALCGKEAPQPDPAKQPEEAKHVAMQETDMLPSVGPAPYCASLVRARNGVLCKDIGEFDSEQDAVEAILLGAARNGLPVDRLCVRHWVTSKNEHIVDFGSHSVYGRIISKLHKG